MFRAKHKQEATTQRRQHRPEQAMRRWLLRQLTRRRHIFECKSIGTDVGCAYPATKTARGAILRLDTVVDIIVTLHDGVGATAPPRATVVTKVDCRREAAIADMAASSRPYMRCCLGFE